MCVCVNARACMHACVRVLWLLCCCWCCAGVRLQLCCESVFSASPSNSSTPLLGVQSCYGCNKNNSVYLWRIPILISVRRQFVDNKPARGFLRLLDMHKRSTRAWQLRHPAKQHTRRWQRTEKSRISHQPAEHQPRQCAGSSIHCNHLQLQAYK